MAKIKHSFRLTKEAIDVIEQHQRRMNFSTLTEALEDAIKRFSESQKSRIKKFLTKDTDIRRILLSDFFPSIDANDIHRLIPTVEVQS